MPVNIGYEVEMATPLNSNQVARDFTRMGLALDRQRNYVGWLISGDGSIRPNYGDHAHEIISPIMSFEDGIEKLHTVLQWMANTGGYTNNSTGFHVGVSNADPNLQRRLDPLKLMIAFDANRVLRSFGRQANHFCPDSYAMLKQSIQDNARANRPNFRDMTLEERILAGIPRQKYCAANLSKLPRYIEFRAMGGRYHDKFELIRNTIQYYAECIELACDPDATTPEYLARKAEIFEFAAHAYRGVDDEIRRAEAARQRAFDEMIAGDLERMRRRAVTLQEMQAIALADVRRDVMRGEHAEVLIRNTVRNRLRAA